MTIGKGTPNSQSNAPLPKPMIASIENCAYERSNLSQ